MGRGLGMGQIGYREEVIFELIIGFHKLIKNISNRKERTKLQRYGIGTKGKEVSGTGHSMGEQKEAVSATHRSVDPPSAFKCHEPGSHTKSSQPDSKELSGG